LTELDWAEQPLETRALIAAVSRRGLGIGMLAGAGEFVAITVQSKLDLALDEALVLGMVSMVAGGLLALVFSVLTAFVVNIRPGSDGVRRCARALGLVAGALAAWHLWPAGAVLLEQRGRLPSAVAFFAMPIGVAGVVALNARYWVRRADAQRAAGRAAGLGWLPLSIGLSGLIVLVASLAMSGAQFGTGRALETDPPVLLITVDTLRRDHVSLYSDEYVQTPAIDELAASGVVFDNAVTPFPETAPAHAAMFTGIHPVRTGVLSNGHALRARYETLAERLAEEGYATAAFVSSFAVDSRTGLDQGFQAYDDDFFPGVRGLSGIRLASLGLRALMRFGDPLKFRSLLERDGEETLGRALHWLRDHGNHPFFMWVHLFEPHAPYEAHGAPSDIDHRAILADEPDEYSSDQVASLRALYAGEVAHTDQLLGDFLDAAQATVDRPMTIIFTADHGEMLGEHGLNFNHHGLYDQTVRVPLVIVPHKGRPLHTRVPAQVRLMDISNTVLSLLGLEQDDGTESGDLTAFMEGLQDRDYGSFLMGRTGRSVETGTVFGYRAAKADGHPGELLKFIWNPGLDKHWLFDLSRDTDERADISLSQSAVVGAMQTQVRKELGTAAPEGASADEAERQALKALGYLD
jgi:arylsulfatase A-like enzyme